MYFAIHKAWFEMSFVVCTHLKQVRKQVFFCLQKVCFVVPLSQTMLYELQNTPSFFYQALNYLPSLCSHLFANQSENFDFCLTHSLCQIKIFSYDNKALSETKKQYEC